MPDDFYGWFEETFAANASEELMRFMRKELYQAVFELLANPDYVHAHFHGFEHTFWDSVVRLVFLRFMTHSADYPEK